jgi:hypothetical protein
VPRAIWSTYPDIDAFGPIQKMASQNSAPPESSQR